MSGQGRITPEDIPEGFQIYDEIFTPAGISFRRDDAMAFARSSGGWLEFEHEPGNKYDRNAIKVIGCTKGLFWTKRRFVGYVPKEVSAKVVRHGLLPLVRPRLMHLFVADDGYIEIRFQILGPKGRIDEYRGGQKNRGMSSASKK